MADVFTFFGWIQGRTQVVAESYNEARMIAMTRQAVCTEPARKGEAWYIEKAEFPEIQLATQQTTTPERRRSTSLPRRGSGADG